jgi:hypothetical protein
LNYKVGEQAVLCACIPSWYARAPGCRKTGRG